MITLKNDFHHTEVHLIPKNGELSAGQIKRSRKILCGCDNCVCSNAAGMRGHDNPYILFDITGTDITGIVQEEI